MTTIPRSPSVPQPPVSRSSRINVGSQERLASLAGGTALALLTRKSRCGLVTRLGLLTASGALLSRGLSGHCWINEKLGRDSALGSIDRDKLNVNGSSLAAGHPFAATGGRIVAALAKMLHAKGPGSRGLISICAAGGQGVVAILEGA